MGRSTWFMPVEAYEQEWTEDGPEPTHATDWAARLRRAVADAVVMVVAVASLVVARVFVGWDRRRARRRDGS